MKILLAVDGSPCSEVAVEEVGRRHWPEDSSVKVLNAFELALSATPKVGPYLQVILMSWIKRCEHRPNRFLTERWHGLG